MCFWLDGTQAVYGCWQVVASSVLAAATIALVYATLKLSRFTEDYTTAIKKEIELRVPSWLVHTPSGRAQFTTGPGGSRQVKIEPVLSFRNDGEMDGILDTVDWVQFPLYGDDPASLDRPFYVGGSPTVHVEDGSEATFEEVENSRIPAGEYGRVEFSSLQIDPSNAGNYGLVFSPRTGETKIWRLKVAIDRPSHPHPEIEGPHPAAPILRSSFEEVSVKEIQAPWYKRLKRSLLDRWRRR